MSAAPPPPNNLPVQLTSFIGREKELAEVTGLVAGHRLVTLTGAGGCGKTRLALATAVSLLETGGFEDGVWWVELASLDDPELVGSAIAANLDVSDQPGLRPADVLADHLRSKRVLVVLDNCEHLIGGCARLVHCLLLACPHLHVLATSRIVLDVVGEHAWLVPPLSVAPPEGAGVVGSLPSEAVQLFVARATAANAAFALGPDSARLVADVCRRLDGIPLAIELAAVRVRSLSVARIADCLDDSLALLTHGAVGSVPHHKTMRATIQWSYDLLDPRQQVLLRRLSVFSGGFTLAAAEDVCADPDDATGDPAVPARAVLDVVAELADRSLVLAEQRPAGRARYRMLETIRQYCAAALTASGEEGALRARHLDFSIGLATTAEQQLLGAEMSEWLDRLDDEVGNIRAAIAWASAEAHLAGRALTVPATLWRFWLVRGHVREGRRHLERLLQMATDVPDRELGRAHNAAGIMALFQADVAPGRAHFGRAHDLFEQAGDERLAALMLGNLAMCDARECQFASARRLYERSIAALRRLGDDRGVANALCNIGLTFLHQGDLAAAQSRYEESLALMHRIGDDWSVAGLRMNLAEVAAHQGRYDEAAGLLGQSLATVQALEDPRVTAQVTCDLAQVTMLQGDLPRAVALLEESLRTSREVGDKEQTAVALMRLGRVMRLQGELRRAAATHGEGAVLHQRIANVRMTSEFLLEAAMPFASWARVPAGTIASDLTSTAMAHSARATKLFARADRLASEFGFALPPYLRPGYERDIARLRKHLGDEAFQTAWSEGEALSAESAFALVVSESAAAELGRLEALLRTRDVTPLQAQKEAFGGLTAREREVAALLAGGLTNNEIAGRLTLAPKTVERHVGNILSKLGFENRAQVAAWAVEKGLAKAPADLDTLARGS